MEFCPKCGGLIISKGKSAGCSKCSYKTKNKIKLETTEVAEEKKEIGVIDEKDSVTLPVTAEDCEKCNHNEAYFWASQTRAADEAETRFFRCTKCKHTWRKYK
ncbi:MAG: transcription factor S [Nanoarchaeota archaeon]|nr:transcription factor S [Nanoarchaeota archaeon]